MDEWKEYKVAEIIEEISMGPFGSNIKRDNYVDSGIPYLNGSNLSSYKLNEDSFNYVTEVKAKSLGRCVAKRGDIIVTHRGTIGQISYIPYDSKYEHYLTGNSQFRLTVNNKIVRPDFFVYYFHTRMGQHRLLANASQVGVPALARPTSTFKEVLVPVPEMEMQNKIMDILHSLDDKIEVNRRINDNLEQQAQALFKSWFEDFEPFKDGEFVESELGMIPKGWKVGKIGELCTFKRGKNLLTKDAIDGGVPVVAGGLEPSCYHNVSNTKSPVVTVSGSGANAGFMRMYYQEVWASDCSFIDSTCYNLLFVYCFLSVNKRLLRHAQTGAVQPHVKPSDIHDFDIVIPTQDIIEEFQTKIEETIQLRGNIEKENICLATLRDTLLPKLMSGELKVNEVVI
jgi:type I restriction enzyme S subunit